MQPLREPLPEAEVGGQNYIDFHRCRSYHRTGPESYYELATVFKQFFYKFLTR